MDLVINDYVYSCCGQSPCSCGKAAMPAYIPPDRMPTPAGLVDNAIDEDDLLLTPYDAVKYRQTQITNAEPDDEILPSVAPPVPTKVTCPQCSGTGVTVEENSPLAEYALPNRTRECNLCGGSGTNLEGGQELSAVAPALAAAMADRPTDNVCRPVYAGSPVTNLQDDFDEDDVLLPNQS